MKNILNNAAANANASAQALAATGYTDTAKALKAAAAQAQAEWLDAMGEELSAEDRRVLFACDKATADSFEYIEEAAEAVYAEYQLETDQVHEQFRELSIYNVRHEAGHRAFGDQRLPEGPEAVPYVDADVLPAQDAEKAAIRSAVNAYAGAVVRVAGNADHEQAVSAERREARAQAVARSLARKAKARRYHDIADVCLGKDGMVLNRSAQARNYAKAKAEDFKAATRGLTVAQCQKVRRFMAKHQATAGAAREALGI